MSSQVRFEVAIGGTTVAVDGADAYRPDGTMITFFRCREGRDTIDSWATRVASFRATDVISVRRVERAVGDHVAA